MIYGAMVMCHDNEYSMMVHTISAGNKPAAVAEPVAVVILALGAEPWSWPWLIRLTVIVSINERHQSNDNRTGSIYTLGCVPAAPKAHDGLLTHPRPLLHLMADNNCGALVEG